MKDYRKIKALKEYFKARPDVILAYLFGSHAEQRAGGLSDWDIGVYFKPEKSGQVEWEEIDKKYPHEDEVWDDLISILKTDDVDLVVLNRCPSDIAVSAISGIPLAFKDRRLFIEFAFYIHRQAEDFREFVNDYYQISQRSSSLSALDKERLQRIINFLDEQMQLYNYFAPFTLKDYQDARKRLEIERWVENAVNSAIDIGEVILASQKKRIPHYYSDIFVELGLLPGFETMDAKKFTSWVKLRNILAHEYLDIRWNRISDFVKDCDTHFKIFLACAKKIIQ